MNNRVQLNFEIVASYYSRILPWCVMVFIAASGCSVFYNLPEFLWFFCTNVWTIVVVDVNAAVSC